MKSKIFIIDDDEKLNELLTEYLAKYGFEVETSVNPVEGLERMKTIDPDLIILDVMLPEIEGFEVCKIIRQESTIPIIMLTARGEITDKVVGLEIGADDYMPKPFEPRELVARIQSVLRRSKSETKTNILDFSGLKVNLENHDVTINDELIELTSTEFELLTLFVKNPGKVLSRDQIMEWVSGIEWESFNRSVDVLVSRLRHKLGDDPKHPKYLKTIWGTGYLFLAKHQ